MSIATKDLQVHDHMCVIYETQEESVSVVAPFLGTGLERGEKCVYLSSRDAAAAVAQSLTAEGVNVQQAQDAGALQFLRGSDIYPGEEDFDSADMVDQFVQRIQAALAEGFYALRLAGEVPEMLANPEYRKSFMEYEARMNDYLAEYSCLFLCLYDTNVLPPEVIEEALLTHPLVAHEKRGQENIHYLAPEKFLGPHRQDEERASKLGALQTLAALREAEREISQREAEYRTLFNSIRDAILVTDTDRNIINCNSAFENLFGYTLEEIQGEKTSHVYASEEEYQRMGSRLRDNMGEREFFLNIHYRKKSGESFVGETNAFYFYDDQGEVAGFSGLIRDITHTLERKEQLQKLNRTVTMLRKATQTSTMEGTIEQLCSSVCRTAVEDGGFRMAWIGFLDGSTGRVEVKASAGVTAGYLDGIDIRPSHQTQGQGPTGMAISTGEPQVCNDIARDPAIAAWREAATQRGYGASASFPLLVDGEPRGALSLYAGKAEYFDDEEMELLDGFTQELSFAITLREQQAAREEADERQRRTEEQLHQAQKTGEMGRLAGGIAHDFNNMLSVILGHTQLILPQLSPTHPLLSDIQAIDDAARHSADMTKQLLAFSRKQIIEPQMLDLHQVITARKDMIERLIEENISLRLVSPPEDLWPIQMDPSQIDQILVNLAVNARDAITGHTGSIIIETSNTRFATPQVQDFPSSIPGSPASGDYVVLSFSDTGRGMDRETASQVFEPFFTTKDTGVGLGLSTVYGIVSQNKGFIQVYSEPELGTTFRIYFPRFPGEAAPNNSRPCTSERPAVRPADSQASPMDDRTVLVVEDEARVTHIVRTVLERNGYTVLTADSPKAALDILEEQGERIDLLLTDVILPGMTGKELKDQAVAALPGLKTLFMSGYTADAIAEHGVLEDGVHFLPKPFTIEDLTARVSEALDS